MQTLWAGPWMQNVAGQTAAQAATGLFWINMAMLATFWSWGMVNPWLLRRGLDANRLMAWGLPSSLLVLAALLALFGFFDLVRELDDVGRRVAGWFGNRRRRCRWARRRAPGPGPCFASAAPSYPCRYRPWP